MGLADTINMLIIAIIMIAGALGFAWFFMNAKQLKKKFTLPGQDTNQPQQKKELTELEKMEQEIRQLKEKYK